MSREDSVWYMDWNRWWSILKSALVSLKCEDVRFGCNYAEWMEKLLIGESKLCWVRRSCWFDEDYESTKVMCASVVEWFRYCMVLLSDSNTVLLWVIMRVQSSVCECRWVIPILVLLSDSNTELLSDSSSALCCWVIPALLASWVIPKMKAAVISECFRIIYSALLLWRRPHWICLLYIMLASIEDYLVRWGCIEFGSTNDVEEMIWLWLWISIKFHLVFDCKSTGHWL